MSINGCMDKEDVAYMHTMEHYLARKIEGNLAIGDNMHLEGIMLSEIRERQIPLVSCISGIRRGKKA